MTDSAVTTICSAVGLGVTFLVTEFFKYKRELMVREQNRADRLAEQQVQTAKIIAKGEERVETLKNEITQVKTVALAGVRNAQKAYKEANGINVKLAENGVKLITDDSTPNH